MYNSFLLAENDFSFSTLLQRLRCALRADLGAVFPCRRGPYRELLSTPYPASSPRYRESHLLPSRSSSPRSPKSLGSNHECSGRCHFNTLL